MCPKPGEQGIDLVDRMIGDASENIGQIGVRIDAAHLCRLCRMPDYAELTLPNLQFPLIFVHFVRHSLTHGLLADTAVGSGPVSTGASENAYLTAVCARCPDHKFCDGCL